jgi:probable rRNA maturation factor
MKFPDLPADAESVETGIDFQAEAIDFQLDNVEKITLWIEQIIQLHQKKLGYISYIFCNDAYLHQINVEYLQHDTYTDIITFPLKKKPLEGDIFISIDRVRENAQTFGVSFEHELHRVIIHGALHLCGFKDKSPAQRKRMTELENESLAILIPILLV